MRRLSFMGFIVALVVLGLSTPVVAQEHTIATVDTAYTVRITNDQLTSVRIYVRFASARFPIGWLSGGESRCITLPAGVRNRNVAFEATNLYGTHLSMPVNVNTRFPWWEWRVTDVQNASLLNVQPAERSCQ